MWGTEMYHTSPLPMKNRAVLCRRKSEHVNAIIPPPSIGRSSVLWGKTRRRNVLSPHPLPLNRRKWSSRDNIMRGSSDCDQTPLWLPYFFLFEIPTNRREQKDSEMSHADQHVKNESLERRAVQRCTEDKSQIIHPCSSLTKRCAGTIIL